MVYLLDANVLIDANRDYYRLDSVPEFWEWLVHLGTAGRVKVPREILDEVKAGKDALAEWLRRDEVLGALLLDEALDPVRVQTVHNVYAPDRPLDDIELEKVAADPLLISYALDGDDERAVVTTETSRPSATRSNRKIPDVCRDLNIDCINTFELTRRLDFRTNWNR